MNEAEFRRYAKAEGYDEPEPRSLPANKFFDTHAHDRDLIVLITAGSFVVDYGGENSVVIPFNSVVSISFGRLTCVRRGLLELPSL